MQKNFSLIVAVVIGFLATALPVAAATATTGGCCPFCK